MHNILIETDAPYLAPQSHRGETNTPAMIVETYKYISALLGMDITPQVVENAKRCYKI
jgi:TatD DNase family protein